MTDGAIISVKDVTKAYTGDGTTQLAVKGASMEVQRGEFVALMGQSGCGKSTLLNMLSGIDKPDSGEVIVQGTSLGTLSETKLALFRRHNVGIVFQFFNLIHNLDVANNVELPGMLAGLSAAEVQKRSRSLMESLEIMDLARKMPGQLSGGQRQRVAIARALINRPAVLFADEPTGALDQENGEAVLRLFRALHSGGQTVVMVTHDLKVAGHADRILLMQDGRITEESRPSESGLADRLLGSRR